VELAPFSPYYFVTQFNPINRQSMKATIANFVSKKGIITKTVIVAGFIMIILPSCKHSGGTCDAYQGSTRSVKAHSHH
jgi:hypothetical protein